MTWMRFCGCCVLAILATSSLAVAASDLRLIEAAKSRDKDAVLALLKQHTDVNAIQGDGTTALHWAAHWDNLEIAQLLIQAGANVNAANSNNVTPVTLACTNGSAPMVNELLKAGANSNAALLTGETPLMTCARSGSAEAVKALLDHGAQLGARETRGGQTALMWAVAEEHSDVVRVLVEHGADVNERSKGTAKDDCVMVNPSDPDLPARDRGAYAPIRCGQHTDGGLTPLLFAARRGDLDSARILLAAGAKVNEASVDGMSPLVMASASGNEAFAIFLLDNGADPNAADANGITAMHYAMQNGMAEIRGIKSDSELYYLFRPNMADLVKALLRHGATPNARIGKDLYRFGIGYKAKFGLVGATPLLLAAAVSDVGIMRTLLAAGADPLLATKDNTTPLMVAAGVGRVEDRPREEEQNALEAVKILAGLGADVNATNAAGQTALHGAADMGANEIIQFLVDKGAKMDVKDKSGQTPLSIAENPAGKAVHKNTVELLRKLTGGAMAQTGRP